MPPKGTLVKGDPRPKKSIPIKPLTTQGKIERAKQQAEKKTKNQPRVAPASAKTADPDANLKDPASKKTKARSFAPPAELAQMDREMKERNTAAARKAASRKSWDFSRGKAMTTQQKEAQARAAQKSKGGVQSMRQSDPDLLENGAGRNAAQISFADTGMAFAKEESRPECSREKGKKKEKPPTLAESLGITKPTQQKKKRVVAPKPLGLMKVLAQQERTAMPMTPPPVRGDSVLMRPTQRAVRDREKLKAKPILLPKPVPVTAKERLQSRRGIHQKKGKNLLDLPDEIRARIWKLCVVNTKFPIWPSKSEDREQPDLAMTCRQIREEVLPIYYSGNTFAVSIIAEQPAKPVAGVIDVFGVGVPNAKELTGLAAAGKWARILQDQQNEEGKWFKMIKSWAFDYQDTHASSDENNFLVSLRFGTSSLMPIQPSGMDVLSMGASFGTISPTIELHQFAACIMPGWTDCGRCVIQTTPSKLNDAIIHMLEHGGMTARNLIDLAREMRDMVDRLSSAKCTRGRR